MRQNPTIFFRFLFKILLLFLLNFNFYFILIYNTVLVLPYTDMNPPRLYMRSQTWTHLPLHNISLGHPRAPAPSMLYPASDIDRGRGWDDWGEWHWNMYNIIYETNQQSRFNAWYWMLGAGVLGWPRGMVQGGRWEGGFRMGNMCIPVVDSCCCMAKPIQYCKVINLQLNKYIYI